MSAADGAAYLDELIERNKLMAPTVRDAFRCLEPLVKDPAAETFLLAPQSIDAWRVLRDQDPDAFLVYLSTVRQRFGNVVARLISDRVGLPGTEGKSRDALPGYTAAAIWEEHIAVRYLVKLLLSPAALTVLFGQSGHFKSVIAIAIALCVATGRAFFGIKDRKAGVLYVAGEGHAGIRKRLRAWLLSQGLDSTSEQPALFVTSAGADLIGNPEQLRLTVDHAQTVLGLPIGLIVVDTLAANFGAGEENNAGDMTRAIAGARSAAPEAAVLLVHHTGHGNGDRERGSYALIAAADYRLQATYDEVSKLLELRWLKCKDDERPEPMTFEWRKLNLGWEDEDGDELTSVVLERLEGASIPRGPRATGLGKNEEIALKTLVTLFARNRKTLTEQGRDPAEAKIMISGWRAACEKKGISRQRWHEVIKSLTADRLIVIDEPFALLPEASS